jgi:AraC-like DNA-binding protein
MRSPSKPRWEDAFAVIEPQINADSVHVWPFHPEFPVDVRFLRFGANHDIRMNRHDYFELLYVCSGSVIYQVRDQLCPLETGDLFVMGSTLLHRIARYRTPGMKAAVLYFAPNLLGVTGAPGEHMEYLMPFLVQEPGFPHVVPAGSGIPGQVFDLMTRGYRELPAASNRARLSVKTYLRMILVLLVNHYSQWRGGEAVFERQHTDLARLQPLFDYIEAHFHEQITVDDAAAILHMSKSSFMRFFKDVTGQSLIGYLNRFRVAKAEVLLAETDLSVLDVSLKAGFCDQSYFGLVFRKLLHVTPREYKSRIRQARRA